jgi:hypothetical protein
MTLTVPPMSEALFRAIDTYFDGQAAGCLSSSSLLLPSLELRDTIVYEP